MPHQEAIQQSFGRHDVSGVKAHVGGAAAEASDAMGAQAYATGDHVAFRGAPDLHTAAHEAAHVVQQRGGVSLKGGVGAVGDRYEQHADQVADAVVAGRSAEPILDKMAGRGAPGGGVQQLAVQRRNGDTPGGPHGPVGADHARTQAPGTNNSAIGGPVPAPRPRTDADYKAVPGWRTFSSRTKRHLAWDAGKALKTWKVAVDQLDINEQVWAQINGDWRAMASYIDSGGRGVFEQIAAEMLPTTFDPNKEYALWSGGAVTQRYAAGQGKTTLESTVAGRIFDGVSILTPDWGVLQSLWRGLSHVYSERIALIRGGVDVYQRKEGKVFAEVEYKAIEKVCERAERHLNLRYHPLLAEGRFGNDAWAPLSNEEWQKRLRTAAGGDEAKARAKAPKLFTKVIVTSLKDHGPTSSDESKRVIADHERALVAELEGKERELMGATSGGRP